MERKFSQAYFLKEMRLWTDDAFNREFMWTERIAAIERSANQPSKSSSFEIVTSVRMVSTWHLKWGARRLFDGDASGWSRLSLGTDYAYWKMRFSHRLSQLNPSPLKQSTILANDAAFALLLGLWQKKSHVPSLGTLMLEGASHRAFLGSDDSPLYMFSLALFLVAAGRSDEVAQILGQRNLGPYAGLVPPFRKVEEAVETAANYHIERTVESDEIETEFCVGPFTILPVELLAWRRVMDEQGHAVPLSDHPLLKLPFPHVPPDFIDNLEEHRIVDLTRTYYEQNLIGENPLKGFLNV